MSIRVATCTTEQLLRGDSIASKDVRGNPSCNIEGQLAIPEYQRPYRWGQKQISRLLEDLGRHIDPSPDELGGPANPSRGQRDSAYFLGTIILHRDDKGRLNLIDGQQRVTTLAIMRRLKMGSSGTPLVFNNPSSWERIDENLRWLDKERETWHENVQLSKIEFSLVVTDVLDDAYLFFETQNTGGIRLDGPDIIKAYHLRAIKDNTRQKIFAAHWEQMEAFSPARDKRENPPLSTTVLALLRGRVWQHDMEDKLPSRNQPTEQRQAVVTEFADQTGTAEDDIAYGLSSRQHDLSGTVNHFSAPTGYALRQPLNAGINGIRYLRFFRELHQRYWINPDLPHLPEYTGFIEWLKECEGCTYLHELYVSCLLLYISRFGERKLVTAAQKIFRVVYARRMTNEKSVREASVPAFVRDHPVLDWIERSYTPDQCIGRFDTFKLIPNSKNLGKNGVKQRFFKRVNERFGLDLCLPSDGNEANEEFCTNFSDQLGKVIENTASQRQAPASSGEQP